MIDWFGNPIKVVTYDGPNPCIKLYGPGPDGKQCGNCSHFHRYQQAATWFKCDLRPTHTKGVSGDHRVRWPACSKFEEGKESE